METRSVWLGPLKQPVRLAAMAASGIALVTFVWLILGQFISADPIDMRDMLRPEGRMDAILMLWSLFASVLLVAIYLSDRIGPIESEPHGAFDVLALVLSRVAMIGILAVVVVMFYEVVSRYALSSPTLWANELSLWIAGFIFLFAGLYAMQQRSHIRIYVIYDLMPRWMQKAADVISVMLIWVFCVCLVWGGFNEAKTKFLRMETFGTAWDPPLPATMKPAILIIISLVALQALLNLIADWNKAADHHSPMDDIDETEIENIRATLKDE
ncbi:MAG: TRAP transporter small permease subunit [Mangrovicoccus sp.]